MSGAKLVLDDSGDDFRLGWDFFDGEGINSWLGNELAAAEEWHAAGRPESEDADNFAANLAVKDLAHQLDRDDFRWESRSAAQKALAVAKAAAKNPYGRILDWEQKALAAGWKPPKGWGQS